MMPLNESSVSKIMELKKKLENNNIEEFEIKNYNLTKDPLTISAGGNFSTQLMVNNKDYIKAKKILKKHNRKEELKRFKVINYLEQIKQLDNLIRSKKTGELSILSKQIGISHRQIIIQLEFLKCLNAKIKFSKEFNSFYYSKPFELLFQFSLLSIVEDSTTEIYCTSEEITTIDFKHNNEYL